MYSTVAELRREGYKIEKVDANSRPELCEKYGVWGLPTFVCVVDGKEVRRNIGYMSKDQLRRMWRKPLSLF